MPLPTKTTIKLDEPIQTHSGFVHEITLRAPTVDDYFEIGDTMSFVTLPSGAVVPQENTNAIRQYVDRLVQPPVDPLMIGGANLRVASQLRDAVRGFFTDARRAGEPSTDSSKNSGDQASSASNTSNG